MLRYTLAIGMILGSFTATANAEDGLQGTWLPVAAELAGKPFPEGIRKTIKLVITENKYTVTVGTQVDEGIVKLTPDARPKQMAITGTSGPNKDKTLLAIYELDGDKLQVCYDLTGAKHPVEFKTAEGTTHFLVKYERFKEP